MLATPDDFDDDAMGAEDDLRVLAGAGVEPIDDVNDEASDDVATSDDSEMDSDMEFYREVEKQHSAKLAAKEKMYSRSPETVVDGKRQPDKWRMRVFHRLKREVGPCHFFTLHASLNTAFRNGVKKYGVYSSLWQTRKDQSYEAGRRSRHEALEEEVIKKVKVRDDSTEDVWAFMLLNFIVGANQLLFDGLTRELPLVSLFFTF
ncbi:hypothetical protein MTR67_003930 [Solanum verrucosum]|uniref:Uncharacterized protein n=1 Tax=Solanum verrucosum TaxID=315347 RepID=A0AAF0PWM7_SOLVR|nr:hypothetical protein MTR67_003930 [Solanum verrucosum]